MLARYHKIGLYFNLLFIRTLINRKKKLIIDFPEKFQEDQPVLFSILNGNKLQKYHGIIKYEIYSNHYFIDIKNYINSIIFSELDINRTMFMHKYFNSAVYGSWPEVSSLKDLHYMLKILSTLNEL